jgi:DNA replication protein DnaC
MINWTFENDNRKTQAMQKARIYANHWQEAKEKGAGLLLWGGVGSGKTYMAACIANKLLNQGKKVLITDLVSITNI